MSDGDPLPVDLPGGHSPYPTERVNVDVLIVGTGPIGCTFARKLVAAGRSVHMVDAGAKLSDRPGAHLKNAFLYQRDLDPFASVIRGHLHLLSVAPDYSSALRLDPAAYQVDRRKYGSFVQNNANPKQDPVFNLPAAAATYAVGGMATHWTCACPRFHPSERTQLLSDAEWSRLYDEAEALLEVRPRRSVSSHPFEESMRHAVVLEALQREYRELKPPWAPRNLPLACSRRQDNNEFVTWSGADTVLGPLADLPGHSAKFTLKEQHRCKRLVVHKGGRIDYAVVENLLEWRTLHVKANAYVLAAGAVLTPQPLYNSRIRPRALGLHLTEQPMAFCQVVLKRSIVEGIAKDPRFARRVRAFRRKFPYDPVPIPSNEPEPQVMIPVSGTRPWHCQIHRDAFQYGDIAPNVDDRVVVDLRWFGIVRQRRENKVTFSDTYHDTFGMPQPTFHWLLDDEDRERQHAMMVDMLRAASCLGGFLPGSEPQFMDPGLTLHIHGTIRMGSDDRTSVTDPFCRVWRFDNLYLGGNGLLSEGSASNPTLTSVALAIRAAEDLVRGDRPVVRPRRRPRAGAAAAGSSG